MGGKARGGEGREGEGREGKGRECKGRGGQRRQRGGKARGGEGREGEGSCRRDASSHDSESDTAQCSSIPTPVCS